MMEHARAVPLRSGKLTAECQTSTCLLYAYAYMYA